MPAKFDSATSAVSFETRHSTADTGTLASLMADGMVVLGSVFYDAGVTLVGIAQPSTTPSKRPLQGVPVELSEPFEPVANSDWEAGG